MSTVTGIAGVTVAILVTVDVFGLSDDVLNSKMSTVTGIAEGRVAILVTVDVFGLSHLLGDSKVSTVTGISGVSVAILVIVNAFELSDHSLEVENVSPSELLGRACECGAINMSGGGWGGAQPPPICKTSNRMAKRHFLLSLAKICLLRSCPPKNERGLCKTSSKMRTLFAELCYVLREHVVSCSALLGLACECSAINMSGGVGGGRSPPHLQKIE